MNNRENIYYLLIRLWYFLSPKRKKQLLFLVFIMILTSFAEVVSISSVLPFIGVITEPNKLMRNELILPYISFFKISNSSDLLTLFTVIFCGASIFSGGMRVLLLWLSTKLSYQIGADISLEVYTKTLYQPLSVHISRNTSEIIDAIGNKTNLITGFIINPILNIVTSTVILLVILTTLLLINPLVVLSVFGGFGCIYTVIMVLTRGQLEKNSLVTAKNSTQVIKSLQEGLGGIRDVLIDGTQSTYCASYRKADNLLRNAYANNTFISGSPRYITESLGMLLISFVAYRMVISADNDTNSFAIPILGMIALAIQRLLPALQVTYSSVSMIRGGRATLRDIINLLSQPMPSESELQQSLVSLPFEKELILRDISFKYDIDLPWVLKEVNFVIKKGEKIGFIGTTGSGKSTLLDIIMGLLSPTTGSLEVDGVRISPFNYRSWQSHIAHVPQSIYLADATIAENIAFGVTLDKINYKKVKLAAVKACIDDAIESWDLKYDTMVGERGVRLSGGQKQRIGIARALYRVADVIIFDEATSALDNKTEDEVMSIINELDKNITVLIIAHRLTTLKCCDKIIELENGKIKEITTYENLHIKK